MTRNFFKMGAFKMIAATVCFSALTSVYNPKQAQATTPVPSARTFIADCSWAGTAPMPTLLVNVRGQNIAGCPSGYFGISGAGWTSSGTFIGETDYVDQAGQHIEVKAAVTFNQMSLVGAAAFVPATATFRGLKTPTGIASEGVEIVDQNGAVLYSTGRDANNNLILLPLMRGSLTVNH